MLFTADILNRRRLLSRALALSPLLFATRGTFAEALSRTARVTEGPFYPTKLPLDTDNDLLIVNDSITPAVGEVTHLSGRILDASGEPIRNALVEIWQVDNHAVYLEEAHRTGKVTLDPNFQGFGRFLTGSTGEYYFRTIKPVPYPNRQAPHVHFKVRRRGVDPWTTQLYRKGHPGNAQDRVYREIGDAKAQSSVTMPFEPLANSQAGELASRFDIVLG